VAEDVHARGRGDPGRLGDGEGRVDDGEGRAEPGVADPGLDVLLQHVEDADGGALGPGARRGRDRDERAQRLGRRPPLADGRVDVVHQLARVGEQQVHRLGGVDGGPAADGHEGVPGPVRLGPLDGLPHALVVGLDVDAVVDVGLDVEAAHLVGDPGREPGGRDAGVGDDQDPLGAVLRQVVADLVARAGAELQQGRAVGEDGLGHRSPDQV
jgi:hypothetical protein